MSTRDGGGLSSASAPLEVISDSESRSSYAGSGESGPSNSNCRWRTTRFHDQECSRYFDCPSHIVERALSHSEEDREEEDDHHTEEQEQARHEQREEEGQEVVNMADPDEHPAGPGTVSPVSEENGSDGGRRLGSHEAVSPLPDAPATDDTAPSAGDDEDEVEITGSRNISREVQVDRPSAPTRVASGTSEDPIDLRDDSPPQTPSRHQPRYPGGELPPQRPSPQQPNNPAEIQTLLVTLRNARPSLARPPRAPRSPDFVLPRWQPDAEVTYCPICRTQFSMWVRKHHCR